MLGVATACSVLALAAAWSRNVPRVATGFVTHILCSATFVSGVDPHEVHADTMEAMPGVGLIAWALDDKIDRDRKEVTTTLFGGGRSRAVYRDGLGCLVENGQGPVDVSLPPSESTNPPSLPEIAGPSLVDTTDPHLNRALDRAFAEPRPAAVSPHQGGRGAHGRPRHRGALCAGLRRRYPHPRVLGDQISHQRADRNPGSAG